MVQISRNQILFLAMDVDGTLTDGKIYIGSEGEMMKAFDVKDGHGIKCILPEHNIVPIVITARRSKIVEQRCAELNVCELHQGVRDKLKALEIILKDESRKDGTNYSLANVAYIGDDVLDLQCIEMIADTGGITGCPADAVDAIKKASSYVCGKVGGCGAVREFIEYLVSI